MRNFTHQPYRSWCPCCVARKGQADTSGSTEKDCLVASMDYMRLNKLVGGPEPNFKSILVLHDSESSAALVAVFPEK